MSGSTDTDTLDLPPPVSGPDRFAVKPYVLQPDAKPVAPYQTAAALGVAPGGAIGVWPPPGNTPGPMVGPNVQASVRPDGTVAYTPPTPLDQTVATLGVQTPNTNAATLGVKPPVQPASLSSPMITSPADRSDRNEGDDWATARQKIMKPESGGKNLWNYRHDENPGYFTASGLFQIVDSTWREGGQLAGIDVSQWKHAIDAPDEVQDQVAHALYKKYGYAPWTKKEGGPLNSDGSTGGGANSGDQYYQRAWQMLGGKPYDPSSINPELERLFRAREAAEQPIMDANLRRQQRDEAEAEEQYDRLKRERDLNDPALRPWTQKPPQPDPVGGLASLGSIFAAFASAFSHTPAIAAMNGMAAAIDARNDGNQKQYDEAFKAYQYNAKLALDRNEIQQKAYDAAWAKVKEDPELGLAQLKSVAQIFNDEQTLLTLESGNLESADKINTGRTEAATKLAKELASIDQFGMFGPSSKDPLYQTYINRIKELELPPYNMSPQDAQLQSQKEYSDAKRGNTVAGQRQEQETTIAKAQYKDMYGHDPSDDDLKSASFAEIQQQVHASAGMGGTQNVERMANLVANYQMAPPQSRSGVGAIIMARVQEIAPDYNARLYSAENKALGNFYGGQEGRSVRSINVAIAHLDTLSDLSDAMRKNDDPRTINRLANMIATETGQPAPTNFALAKQIVSDEIKKAIVPGGGGQAEREELTKQLDAANSPEQLQGAIETAQRLLAGQTAGLRQQFVGTTGLPGGTFDGMLMDRTKQVLGTDAADAGKARPTTPAGQAAAPQTFHYDKDGNRIPGPATVAGP
jgi:hypothetical protein